MYKRFVCYILMLMPALVMAGDSVNNGWLNAQLYGSDNDVAALKAVRIYKENDGYKVYITNQFKFECDLQFDEKGDPSIMSNCITLEECREPWKVVEQQIRLKCFSTKKEDICRGEYTLVNRSYRDSGEMTIAKRK